MEQASSAAAARQPLGERFAGFEGASHAAGAGAVRRPERVAPRLCRDSPLPRLGAVLGTACETGNPAPRERRGRRGGHGRKTRDRRGWVGRRGGCHPSSSEARAGRM